MIICIECGLKHKTIKKYSYGVWKDDCAICGAKGVGCADAARDFGVYEIELSGGKGCFANNTIMGALVTMYNHLISTQNKEDCIFKYDKPNKTIPPETRYDTASVCRCGRCQF